MRKTAAIVALITLSSISSLFAQISDGDQAFANRADGHQGARAQSAGIDAAIAAYERAVAQSPKDLEGRWKLLRALRYKGMYVATSKDDKRKIFDQARKIGAQGISILDGMLAAKGVGPVTKTSEKKVAEAIRQIPNAGELVYWDAVSWGEWALVYGKLAAVKEGAADRIKRESTIVMMTDPKIEGGGGARVLGRLHNQTPHVPFLTGWASDSEAVKYLNQSLTQDPSNKVTKVFLAEAMVAANRDSKPQAIQMLREVISSANDPAYLVEQMGAQDDARQLLKAWGAK